MLNQEHQQNLELFQRLIRNNNDHHLSEAQQIEFLQGHDWNTELAYIDYSNIHQSFPTLSHQSTNMNNGTAFGSEIARVQHAFSSVFSYLLQQRQSSPVIENEESSIDINSMPGSFPLSTPPNNIEHIEPTPWQSFAHKTINLLNKGVIVLCAMALFVFTVPLYLCYRLVVYIFFFIISIMSKIQSNSYVSKRVNDPINVAGRFIIKFDEKIGNKSKNNLDTTNLNMGPQGNLIEEEHLVEISRPDFMECAYSHALYMVKKEMRWLLVYIESDKSDDSLKFTNDVLINPHFLKFIKERKFLVWGGDITDSESFQVANQFKVTKLPFLGLLCLTVNQIPTSSGVQQSPPILSLVSKIQGYKALREVLSKLDRAYEKYNPSLTSLRVDTERNDQGRTTRQLQDEAYQNSLRRDRERREQQEAEALRERQSQQREQNRIQWLKWRKSQIKPENNQSGEFARIAFRLPNGQRVQFKFDKKCHLEELYAYVECILLNNVETRSNESYTCPSNYTPEYLFKIVSVMPREEIPVDETQNIEDSNLVYPSGNLIVEMLE